MDEQTMTDDQMADAIATFIANGIDWLIIGVVAVILLVLGWFMSKWISKFVGHVMPHTKAIDETVTPMIMQVVQYLVFLTFLVIALGAMGVQTTSIIAVIGAAGLAIALALQGTLSNIAAGVMIIWLRPFNVGDFIDTGNISGTVKQVGLFATRLRTPDGLFIFSPNAKIWDAAITNYSREITRRIDFNVGIAYDADIDLARETLLKVAQEDERVLNSPEPVVYVMNLGASSVDLQLRAWTRTSDHWATRMDLNEFCKKALDKAGVDIPFPHVQIIAPDLKNNS